MSYWSSEFTPFDRSRHAAPVPVRDALIALIVGLIVVAVTWMTVAFVDTRREGRPCDAPAWAAAGEGQGGADEDVDGGCGGDAGRERGSP